MRTQRPLAVFRLSEIYFFLSRFYLRCTHYFQTLCSKKYLLFLYQRSYFANIVIFVTHKWRCSAHRAAPCYHLPHVMATNYSTSLLMQDDSVKSHKTDPTKTQHKPFRHIYIIPTFLLNCFICPSILCAAKRCQKLFY